MSIAETVKNNAELRTDQKNVNISSQKPHYSAATHYTQYKSYNPDEWFYIKHKREIVEA